MVYTVVWPGVAVAAAADAAEADDASHLGQYVMVIPSVTVIMVGTELVEQSSIVMVTTSVSMVDADVVVWAAAPATTAAMVAAWSLIAKCGIKCRASYA